MRTGLIYFAIVMGTIFTILMIEVFVYYLITIFSKKKYNLRIAKIDNEFYVLSSTLNKGKSFVDLYADRSMVSPQKDDNVNVDEEIKEEKSSVFARVGELNKVKDKKNHMVIHYYNIKDPYLNVLYYETQELVKQKRYYLHDYNIENGVITNLEPLAKVIHEDFNYSVNVDLKLSINECFKHSVSLPKIAKYKAITLAKQDIKNEYPNVKQKYYQISNQYNHNLGYVFDTYFVPNNIILCFRKLCKLINCRLATYDLYGNYIYNIINRSYEGSYSYVYTHENMGLILKVSNNKLTAMHDFTFDSFNELLNKYLLVISKHEFEYEKERLDTLFIDSKYYEEFKNIGLNAKEYNVVLNDYIPGGVKL